MESVKVPALTELLGGESRGDNDAETTPESLDFITTFDAVHDQGRYNVLKRIHRALKRDGVYRMQDIKGSSHVHKKSSRRRYQSGVSSAAGVDGQHYQLRANANVSRPQPAERIDASAR
jgi:hypothetical protein